MNRRYDTKRFILATGFLAFVLCVFILLTACSNNVKAAVTTQYSQYIEIIATIALPDAVVYYQTTFQTAAVSITPMYNADGLPKTMK